MGNGLPFIVTGVLDNERMWTPETLRNLVKGEGLEAPLPQKKWYGDNPQVLNLPYIFRSGWVCVCVCCMGSDENMWHV